ncbi:MULTISPECIES: hypothetical protein [Microcoleaceae]|uniref:hypothetical protein n=1 Tax=Microcoleaceae TaxID=1892252 RepID=UPI0018829E42|nr:hypothetical protein [Tychonema sp. LEGE 06208]MBE9164479.1 hypothetical protein [Tychonema sp. LEGE 06208]
MRSPLKKYSSGFFKTLPLTDRPIGAIIAVFHLRDVVSGRIARVAECESARAIRFCYDRAIALGYHVQMLYDRFLLNKKAAFGSCSSECMRYYF